MASIITHSIAAVIFGKTLTNKMLSRRFLFYVAFFSPLENSRYFFPYTPLEVSPIGVRGFFSQRGIDILINEFSWVVLPLLVLFGLKKLTNKYK